MSIIAEFSVSSPKFTLYEASTSVPSVELELTNQFATDPNRPWLYFWAEGEGLDAFDTAMAADETVTNVRTYTDLGPRRLYRVQISDAVELVTYPFWVEEGASRLETTCQDGVWYNRFRFPGRETFRTIHQWCQDHDIEFTLHALYTEADDGAPSHAALTPEQIETLTTAYEAGHFEIPQEVTAAEVAAELGISPQAVSERLRRAYARLVESHVLSRDE